MTIGRPLAGMRIDVMYQMRRNIGAIFALAAFFAMLPVCRGDSTAAGGTTYVYPFAINSNAQYIGGDYPSKALDAGAEMVRLDIATFPNIRPSAGNDPNQWQWGKLEKLRAIKQQIPKLDYLLVLGYGTAWAADPRFSNVKSGDGADPERGADVLPVESADNLYGNYVYETVKRYKDICKTWESWNEPDLPGHSYFKGNGGDFLPLQRACYLAAKKADPDCTVLFAGMCYANIEGYLSSHGLKAPTINPPPTSFFEEYLKACAKDPDARKNHYYFDVMNQHSYSRATDLYDYPAVLQKLMRAYLGEVKPVWITEMGVGDTGGMFGVNPEEYCDYLLQSFAWGSLAGIQKFFHFQLDNSNGLGLYDGMLGHPKPALFTYRDVLVKELADAKFVSQLHGHAGVGFLDSNSPFHPSWATGYDAFEFRSNDGRHRILMAFADKSDAIDIDLPALAASATLIDRHNNRSLIEAHNGMYHLRLAGATNNAGWPSDTKNPAAVALGQPEHLVGGATLLIDEVLPPGR
jgi:hypothetical protein